MTTPSIDARTLENWLADGAEIALLDVREAGLYGAGHALLAVNLPLSRLEPGIAALVPRRDARIVLIAEDDAGAGRAAAALAAAGYSSVSTLAGGAPAWAAAGLPVFQGVNVPSKAFAEFVEHAFHTPDITAQELARLQRDGTDLILLDSRTVEEHRRFHVPGAIACPGSELVPRFEDLVPSPQTLVVVTCAGRTRGVMGAQTLISAGVPNRVVALRGGTQGWKLAGLALETGPAQEAAEASASARERGAQRAAALARSHGITAIDRDTLARWRADAARTTYVFDVRTQDEYLAGHIPGAIWAQGVQLIQCVDQFAAVRGARVVLTDDDGIRATLTAYWLRQLGWDAVTLTQARGEDLERGAAAQRPALPELPSLNAKAARQAQEQGALLFDTSPSAAYRQAHPAGARWANRSRLQEILAAIEPASQVIVIGSDEDAARLVAGDIAAHAPVAVVEGGVAAWRAVGLPLESSGNSPADGERIDFLFWLHDRHEGNAASSAAYLKWEEQLPAAVGDPARAGLRLAV